MALPTITQPWTISANNRITYVSLLDTTQQYLYGIKAFLVANGYTVVWSASGGIGPVNSADHTDRWSSAATVTPRATVEAASQGWCLVGDQNSVQILLTFQGASDDVARISFSPGSLFTLAGVTNNQPTATDENIITSASLVGSTPSGDRVWHGWVGKPASRAELCRFAIGRAGVCQHFWCVEDVNSIMVASVLFSPATWGGYWLTTYMDNQIYTAYALNQKGGLLRASVQGSIPTQVQVSLTSESNGGSQALGTSNYPLELNGNAYPLLPLSVWSDQVGAYGIVGPAYDWWIGKTSSADGDTYGTLQFITVGGSVIWPWNGITIPTYT